MKVVGCRRQTLTLQYVLRGMRDARGCTDSITIMIVFNIFLNENLSRYV